MHVVGICECAETFRSVRRVLVALGQAARRSEGPGSVGKLELGH